MAFKIVKSEYSVERMIKCLIFLPYSSILNSMNNESRPYSNAVRALSVSIAFICRRNPFQAEGLFLCLEMDVLLKKTLLTSILGGIYASVIDC